MSRAAPPRSERRIEPRLLPPGDGTPFFDEELDLAHSLAHRRMIFQIGSILEALGDELGCPQGFDNPIWFLETGSTKQKVLYPDIVLLERGTDPRRATAEDALFVGEVVTTTDRRKEGAGAGGEGAGAGGEGAGAGRERSRTSSNSAPSPALASLSSTKPVATAMFVAVTGWSPVI